jgi:hypothetical protein
MWSLVVVYLQGSRRGAACEVAFRVGFPGHAVRTDGWKERYNLGQLGLEKKAKKSEEKKTVILILKELAYPEKKIVNYLAH